jgi:hypothetical protein
MLAVLGNKSRLVAGHIVVGENRRHWAGGHAGTAINALVGVDVELVIALVDAILGANIGAGCVFGANAGLGNYIRHKRTPPIRLSVEIGAMIELSAKTLAKTEADT